MQQILCINFVSSNISKFIMSFSLFVCLFFLMVSIEFSMYQFSSVAQSDMTLCNPLNCSTPGLPVHHQLPEFTKLMSTELVMPSSHLIFCCPLLLLPSIFPNIRVVSNESALCIRWPKYWSFSFNISPSNEHPELISFGMDWLNFLAVQGTLKSLLHHHSSKASIFPCSGPILFFLSNLDYFYYFSFLNAVTRASNTTLNKSDKSGYNCLCTYLRGNTFKVFTVEY